jgi:biopolymer transport protein TolR
MLRNHSNSLRPIRAIDVTAFSSVLAVMFLTLFIIEMLVSPLARIHHGVGIDLPKVDHPVKMLAANREDAMVIAVMRDGQIFFGNERVSVEDLPNKIRERLSHDAERKVYINADARVPYGTLSPVLDEIRSAGVLRIAFLAEQRRVSLVAQ